MPPKDTSDMFAVEAAPAPAAKPAAADPADAPDPRRLEQRRKQIDMGKNTRGYAAYTAAVPRDKRRALHGGLVPVDPITPDVHAPCSKRAFDGQVRKWRRMLHAWDPEEGGAGAAQPTALGVGGGGAEAGAAEDGEEPAAAGASPGTKRDASARTPATAGRRKQGRTQGGGRGGGSGGGGGGGAAVAAQAPAAAAAAGGGGKTDIFADFEETEDWTVVPKPAGQ